MSNLHYLQACPICGRRLQIKVEHIGRTVSCFHCHASLLAQDPEMAQANDDCASAAENGNVVQQQQRTSIVRKSREPALV